MLTFFLSAISSISVEIRLRKKRSYCKFFFFCFNTWTPLEFARDLRVHHDGQACQLSAIANLRNSGASRISFCIHPWFTKKGEGFCAGQTLIYLRGNRSGGLIVLLTGDTPQSPKISWCSSPWPKKETRDYLWLQVFTHQVCPNHSGVVVTDALYQTKGI